MEQVEKALLLILRFAFFVVLSVIFLPSFLVVTYLQTTWAKLFGELFKV